MLTVEDSKGWHMREAAHLNGGAEWFGYLHRCIEQPRLSRFDRYGRKDRSVASTWRVDGQDQPDFATAVAALNVQPILTHPEWAMLAAMPDEFADIRDGLDWQTAEAVRNKGMIEWQKGHVRRTDLGRTFCAREGVPAGVHTHDAVGVRA